MRGKKEGAGQGWRGGCPSAAGAIPECLGHGTDVPSRKRTQVSGLDEEEVESRRWLFYSTDGRTRESKARLQAELPETQGCSHSLRNTYWVEILGSLLLCHPEVFTVTGSGGMGMEVRLFTSKDQKAKQKVF